MCIKQVYADYYIKLKYTLISIKCDYAASISNSIWNLVVPTHHIQWTKEMTTIDLPFVSVIEKTVTFYW